MPKIQIDAVPERRGVGYPEPFVTRPRCFLQLELESGL